MYMIHCMNRQRKMIGRDNQSISQSINQSINQSISQSVSQSVSQSTNTFITRTVVQDRLEFNPRYGIKTLALSKLLLHTLATFKRLLKSYFLSQLASHWYNLSLSTWRVPSTHAFESRFPWHCSRDKLDHCYYYYYYYFAPCSGAICVSVCLYVCLYVCRTARIFR